jgi:hypothetical protein
MPFFFKLAPRFADKKFSQSQHCPLAGQNLKFFYQRTFFSAQDSDLPPTAKQLKALFYRPQAGMLRFFNLLNLSQISAKFPYLFVQTFLPAAPQSSKKFILAFPEFLPADRIVHLGSLTQQTQ